jgi:hypothetical protein
MPWYTETTFGQMHSGWPQSNDATHHLISQHPTLPSALLLLDKPINAFKLERQQLNRQAIRLNRLLRFANFQLAQVCPDVSKLGMVNVELLARAFILIVERVKESQRTAPIDSSRIDQCYNSHETWSSSP